MDALSEVLEILFWNVVKSVEERYPLAPVDDCVMVKAPVVLLYASGADAERLEDEILFWKVDQSVEVKTPLFVADAEGRLKIVC